jgi:hypothetical protein
MAINISDAGAKILFDFTTAYTEVGVIVDYQNKVIPIGKTYVEKTSLNVKAEGNAVIVYDGVTVLYVIQYTDITSPSGAASAAAAALLIEAMATTSASQRTTATIMQNAAVANGNGTSLDVTGYPVALLNIVSSPSMSGGTTINFEASVDDTTWVSIAAHQIGVNGSLESTATADGDFRLATAGYKSIRARISAYSAGTITIKGYANSVASQPTVIAIRKGATSTTANVASSATVVTLQAANSSRVKLTIVHDDTASTLYVKEGSTATLTDYTYKLSPSAYGDTTLIIDDYSGIVTGIWSVATGTARVTETV